MALGEDDSNLFGCDCPSSFDQRPDNGIVMTIFGRQDIAFVGVLPALYPSDVLPAPPPRARGSDMPMQPRPSAGTCSPCCPSARCSIAIRYLLSIRCSMPASPVH